MPAVILTDEHGHKKETDVPKEVYEFLQESERNEQNQKRRARSLWMDGR